MLNTGLALSEKAQVWAATPRRFGQVRVSWSFDHPILLALFLGLGLICILELNRRGKLRTWVAYCGAILLVVGEVLTLSRGPMAMTVVALCVWLWLAKGAEVPVGRRLAALLVAASVVVAVWTIPALRAGAVNLFAPRGGAELTSGSYRVDLARAFAGSIGSASLFGTGATGTPSLLTAFVSLDNEYANLLVRRGAVGLSVFCILLFGPTAYLLIRHRGSRDPNGPWVTAVCVYVAGSLMTVALFGTVAPYVYVVIGLCWGALAAGAGSETAGRAATPPPGAALAPAQTDED